MKPAPQTDGEKFAYYAIMFIAFLMIEWLQGCRLESL